MVRKLLTPSASTDSGMRELGGGSIRGAVCLWQETGPLLRKVILFYWACSLQRVFLASQTILTSRLMHLNMWPLMMVLFCAVEPIQRWRAAGGSGYWGVGVQGYDLLLLQPELTASWSQRCEEPLPHALGTMNYAFPTLGIISPYTVSQNPLS